MTAAELRDWIVADFGVVPGEVTPVGHGADAAAAVWMVRAGDTRYAVKWSGGGSAAGLLLPDRLASLGVDGVPAPVRALDGGLWSERDGRRLSLQPWVSDVRAVDAGLSPGQWTAFGALLARVHAVSAADVVARELPVEEHRPDAVLAATAAVTARLAGDGSGDDLVRGLAAAWRDGVELLGALTVQAAVLGARLRDRPARAVVCHTDAHLGNVLAGDDDAVWLIDWDDATLAPPERDLMFVVGGLPGYAPVGEWELGRFAEGYGAVDVDPDRLSYYRTVRALADLTEFAAELLDPAGDRADREFALRIVRAELTGAGLAALAVGAA
ncbi:aminoglycoside phosphotransferase family protein [Jiangella alkaliphila]|uniref:Spectinomycin phosphotransferase n=1 Tax=Jiangella alkaliphila TaxID=419479 RepID=A0A1H2JJ18_9ACTN|nr:aminoglycoside phosphotransferase family protein [Jiangella alkaliphila]SDU56347.1 spectinomycin phosphotransferase [Jiangella alkaliphila]